MRSEGCQARPPSFPQPPTGGEGRRSFRIRWTRNDTGLGLVNSQTAAVAAVGDGKVTFRLKDGRMLDLSQSDPQLRRVDRAWASTVHAFQGRTLDTVIRFRPWNSTPAGGGRR